MQQQPNNKLHGKTLEMILNTLVAHYGWPELGYRIRINCFLDNLARNGGGLIEGLTDRVVPAGSGAASTI